MSVGHGAAPKLVGKDLSEDFIEVDAAKAGAKAKEKEPDADKPKSEGRVCGAKKVDSKPDTQPAKESGQKDKTKIRHHVAKALGVKGRKELHQDGASSKQGGKDPHDRHVLAEVVDGERQRGRGLGNGESHG